jgi:serine/threonine protein kinase
LPGTARLRYLVDDIAASMAFRLPVARYGDVPGVPVRSLTPTTRSSSGSQMPTQPYTLPSLAPHPVQPPLPPTLHVSRTLSRDSARTIQHPEELIGMTLGTCQIEALLGQGGFGAVYRAKQTTLNRYVAVKVILATLSDTDEENRRVMSLRFDHEAQAIARLDHPHILTIYEYQPGPLPYLVMPYITGGSLADERAASGYRPLPASGVAVILQQVAAALDHAHLQHLIHRDIKPHNLLRHQDGRILLSDFGIAQFVDKNHIALTTAGEQSPYTPAYASPEQLQGLALDYHSDIYSLGVVIYELLAGQGLFPGLLQHLEAPPSITQKFGVPVSPAIEAVVAKALAKQPAQRYQSAGEMANAFQAVLVGIA